MSPQVVSIYGNHAHTSHVLSIFTIWLHGTSAEHGGYNQALDVVTYQASCPGYNRGPQGFSNMGIAMGGSGVRTTPFGKIFWYWPWKSATQKSLWKNIWHWPKKTPIKYCKITYFRWDFTSRFCHIVSLQQSKIRIFGRVVIENPIFSYSLVLFSRSWHPRENKTHAKISDFTVIDFLTCGSSSGEASAALTPSVGPVDIFFAATVWRFSSLSARKEIVKRIRPYTIMLIE
jgi:hypothetical protein